MQRFFVSKEDFGSDGLSLVSDSPRNNSLIHQLSHVLRMKPGNECVFLDNSGCEYLARITKISPRGFSAEIIEKKDNAAEPPLFLTLYQAFPKKRELFEWVLQKGTEIGVAAFVPLITERTERHGIGNPERLERILREAAEQCGRGKIPQLREPAKLQKLLLENALETKILLHEHGTYPLLSDFSGQLKNDGPIGLFVGPEGGFSEKEVEDAKAAGFSIASLGPRVLRTETAGVAGAALLLL